MSGVLRNRWLWFALGGVVVVFVLIRAAIGSVAAPALGLRDGDLRPCPDTPNCVRSGESDAEHAIAPLACSGDDLEDVVAIAFRELPRTEVVTFADGYAHLTSTSRWFGFVDDLELLAAGDRLEVRSAARLGRGDLGVNRARVEELRAQLEAAGLCR